MTGMLIAEQFVAVLPSLVRAFGGNIETAMVLQVLHFHADDGRVRITAQQIVDETGIPMRTVRRRLAWLRENELIIHEGRSESFDPTVTHTINYGHPILSSRECHGDTHSECHGGTHSSIENSKNVPELPLGLPAREKPASRATPLPEDWEPDATMSQWVRENCPHIDADYEWDQFRDHALANGRTQKRWNQAWQMWARRAEKQIVDRQQRGRVNY